MASIKERNGSYQITASCGRDIYGKKLIKKPPTLQIRRSLLRNAKRLLKNLPTVRIGCQEWYCHGRPEDHSERVYRSLAERVCSPEAAGRYSGEVQGRIGREDPAGDRTLEAV